MWRILAGQSQGSVQCAYWMMSNGIDTAKSFGFMSNSQMMNNYMPYKLIYGPAIVLNTEHRAQLPTSSVPMTGTLLEMGRRRVHGWLRSKEKLLGAEVRRNRRRGEHLPRLPVTAVFSALQLRFGGSSKSDVKGFAWRASLIKLSSPQVAAFARSFPIPIISCKILRNLSTGELLPASGRLSYSVLRFLQLYFSKDVRETHLLRRL
ncbi:hypothetical protein QR685DRAFT_543945 [Neurospora intermedia]|uniref:Uncharacterized protein n=1 Tax=Neurospora intermedia TaxID=5142 RepID=A0ABR3DBX9_NEUIN